MATTTYTFENLTVYRTQLSGPREFEHEDLRIIENPEIDRLQIVFPGKPDEETRKSLKSYGFRWSPSEGAWQRQLSNSARYAAEQVTGFKFAGATPIEAAP
jgi:hypothetical protein